MELKSKRNSVAIIIPMYNEEKVGGKCIDEVVRVIKDVKIPIKIIIVNDGSFDNTKTVLNEKLNQYKKHLIIKTHKKNKGYGAATQTGISIAISMGSSWALHMDSDLTNDPKYIPHFLRFINSKYDCIKASRYIKDSKVINVTSFRRLISVVGNYVAHHLFNVGIKDCTNGFRIVRLEKLKGLTLKEKDFSVILEELYYLKKKRAKFTEIPYVLSARSNSKSHFIYKPKIFVDYFKYALRSFVNA